MTELLKKIIRYYFAPNGGAKEAHQFAKAVGLTIALETWLDKCIYQCVNRALRLCERRLGALRHNGYLSNKNRFRAFYSPKYKSSIKLMFEALFPSLTAYVEIKTSAADVFIYCVDCNTKINTTLKALHEEAIDCLHCGFFNMPSEHSFDILDVL